MTQPFVSIITVNYNGKGFLSKFLKSAQSQNYPKQKFEVIVVDNNSSDDSVKFISQNFPEVVIIESQKNLGFGLGNNLGMEKARGSLCFLVNNDTLLTVDALKNIVKCFEKNSKNKKVGAINSKLVLIDKYLKVKIDEAMFVGFKSESSEGVFNKEPLVRENMVKGKYSQEVHVPISYNSKGALKIRIDVRPYQKNDFKVILANKLVVQEKFKKSDETRTIKFELSSEQVRNFTVDLIQNAGNIYFRDGHGRDRGVLVSNNHQFYEEDAGQYGKVEEIPGFCGAAVLINKKAINEVGSFSKDFFMYYEDGDLSFRMRAGGWKILFSPECKVRHIHSASSSEWSNFFIYHTERGRLLFLFRHWPKTIIFYRWLQYIMDSTLGVPLYYLSKGENKKAKSLFLVRVRVNRSVIVPFVRELLSPSTRLSKKDVVKLL